MLVSFDIDGTMDFGQPAGPVSSSAVRELIERGHIVGVASDWARSTQRPIWRKHGVEPEFVGGKHHLQDVRVRFDARRWIHVGDSDLDEWYATRSGFEFIRVDEMSLPVTADSIERLLTSACGDPHRPDTSERPSSRSFTRPRTTDLPAV